MTNKDDSFLFLNDPYLLELSERLINSTDIQEISFNFNEYFIIYIKFLSKFAKEKTNIIRQESIKVPEFVSMINQFLENNLQLEKFNSILKKFREDFDILQPQYLMGEQEKLVIQTVIRDVSIKITNFIEEELSGSQSENR